MDSYTERLERVLGELLDAIESSLPPTYFQPVDDVCKRAHGLLALQQPVPWTERELEEFRRWHLELRLKRDPDDLHESPEVCRCAIAKVLRREDRAHVHEGMNT
jgi:hypothetical protein